MHTLGKLLATLNGSKIIAHSYRIERGIEAPVAKNNRYTFQNFGSLTVRPLQLDY